MPKKNVLTHSKSTSCFTLKVGTQYNARTTRITMQVSSLVQPSKTVSVVSGSSWISYRVSYLYVGMYATWIPITTSLCLLLPVCAVCASRGPQRRRTTLFIYRGLRRNKNRMKLFRTDNTLNSVASYLVYWYYTSSATATRIVYSYVRHAGIMHRTMSYVQCAYLGTRLSL